MGGSFAPGGSAAAPAEKSVPFGQVQLTKSGSNLLLSPFAGNLITINSKVYAVPDAGITLATGGLAASTVYYVYAYDNSGTLTLEASATAYATQAGTGIRIKNGDATPMDLDIMASVCVQMTGTALCVLADAMAMPVGSMIKHFRDEFEAYIDARREERGLGVGIPQVNRDEHAGPKPLLQPA